MVKLVLDNVCDIHVSTSIRSKLLLETATKNWFFKKSAPDRYLCFPVSPLSNICEWDVRVVCRSALHVHFVRLWRESY